jgi:hypothetical protein
MKKARLKRAFLLVSFYDEDVVFDAFDLMHAVNPL